MAKLVPPYLDKSCKSSGEKLIFEIFKNNDFTKDWIILHSLNLSQHTVRLYGEIDFLILIPNGGIFVLEVKGGDVKCTDGVWQFTDKFKNTFSSNIGPFNQARDAMFSLKAGIEKEFGKGHRFTKFLYGFLCAFPHINFNKNSVEYEPWQIFDKDIIERGSESFFKDLVNQFINKHKYQRWFSIENSLPNEQDIEEISNFLRGDFERIRTAKERLSVFNKEVKRYTKEQCRILDSIQLNERSVIQGSAGTGKTMIAMESAIQAASEGKKVFFTCFNKLIGEWVEEELKEWKDYITVGSLHNYLFEVSKGFDYDKSHCNLDDFYSNYLPKLVTDLFKKGINTKFDKLIIDEGQDLIRKEYLNLFDAMLDNGLKKGNWEIYGDFESQAIYSQLPKKEMLNLLINYGQYSNFLLKINCRNTKQIGEETSLVSGFEKPPFLLEHLEGIPVEYIFYTDNSNQKTILEFQLKKMEQNNIPKNDLVIIAPRKLENSCSGAFPNSYIQEIKNNKDLSPNQDFYGFATIQSYKGMESNYILITDIEDLNSELAKSLLYVGMSRAKYGLILFISEAMRASYRETLKRKLS